MRVRWFTTMRVRSRLKMNGIQPAPPLRQVLADESPVAALGRRLAAQQHRWDGEDALVDALLDLPLGHESQKLPLVLAPAPFALLVGVEHLLRRSQQRLVRILGPADHAQEVG